MKYIDQKVPNSVGVYRVFSKTPEGNLTPTGSFRVRKRTKVGNKWTSRVETFCSFDEAKAFSRLTPQHIVQRTEKFSEVLEAFFKYKENEVGLAAGSIHHYRGRAKHFEFFAPLLMPQVTSAAVDRWIDLLVSEEYRSLQSLSRKSYELELTLLNNIFQYYREFLDETFVNPILKRHRTRSKAGKQKHEDEIRYLNSDQVEVFLSHLESHPVIRDLAIFQLETGTRVGEAAALDYRSVFFNQDEVRIENHLYWERFSQGKTLLIPGTKGGPARTIPLSSRCKQMLLGRRKSVSGSFVFEDPKTRSWLAYRSVQAIYDRAFKKMGVPHSGTHSLRHTFAVRFLNTTKDIYALQRILGHTKLEVTQVYAKYSMQSVREAFLVFSGDGKITENLVVVPNLAPNFLVKV